MMTSRINVHKPVQTRIAIADHYKDQLLMTVMHYADSDLRTILAREVPAAYNAICGATYATVIHNDGSPW